MFSLYLFSSFVQGSSLLSAANVVSHACTLACLLPACRVPHCSTHLDSLLGPHLRPNSTQNNQNQPKKHFLGTVAISPPARWGVTDGCHYLPAQASSQGLAFKGDYILR